MYIVGLFYARIRIHHARMNEDTKIIEAFAVVPIPSQRIMIGIHAIGGIGRNRSKRGFAMRSTFLYHAIAMPSGTPNIAPSANPLKAISRLAIRFCSNVAPSGDLLTNFFRKVVTTLVGLGKTYEGKSLR